MSKYTREDKYRAAAAYVIGGNSIRASQDTDIPGSTIRFWAQQDEEFQIMCQEVKTEYGERIKGSYAEIIVESTDQVLDRLKNGDVVRDTKTGELVRVPIKGKDAAIIGAVAFDKLRLAENQPTSIVHHDNTEKRLSELAKQFEAISRDYDGGSKGDLKMLSSKRTSKD